MKPKRIVGAGDATEIEQGIVSIAIKALLCAAGAALGIVAMVRPNLVLNQFSPREETHISVKIPSDSPEAAEELLKRANSEALERGEKEYLRKAYTGVSNSLRNNPTLNIKLSAVFHGAAIAVGDTELAQEIKDAMLNNLVRDSSDSSALSSTYDTYMIKDQEAEFNLYHRAFFQQAFLDAARQTEDTKLIERIEGDYEVTRDALDSKQVQIDKFQGERTLGHIGEEGGRSFRVFVTEPTSTISPAFER